MSVSVGRTSAALFQEESAAIHIWSAPTKIHNKNRDEQGPDQSSIWTMIQSQKPTTPNVAAAPYVHPLVRRSVSFMSKSSLEMCTESLGSENGSGDFSMDNRVLLNSPSSDLQVIVEHKKRHQKVGGGEDDGNHIMSVNCHHSDSQRSHTPRSFPPPLPTISCREDTRIQMRTRRQDGHLVVDAVPVSSLNNLHIRRHGGRLHLSFTDSTATTQPTADKTQEPLIINKEDQSVKQVAPPSKEINQSKEVAEDEDEDEEEVEVLDRGTMVEVKVSTQTQQPGRAKKVLRSSLVINKFVGGTPLTNQNRWAEPAEENHQSDPLGAWQPSLSPQRRLTATNTTTTAAAAAVAASSASTSSVMMGQQLPLPDNKLLFTFKRRNREEMLHHIRRCSELRQPLFFWEAGCIATSS